MSKCVDKYIHIYMKESEMNDIEQFLKRFLSSGLRPGFVMEINSIIKLMK